MLYKVGSLVQWFEKDEWWLPECPLVMRKIYRITKAIDNQQKGFPDQYMIGGWWVQGQWIVDSFYEFHIGDSVRVALKVEKEEGWDNSWAKDMDGYVGMEFTIDNISNFGVRFMEDNTYAFPPGSLEPV